MNIEDTERELLITKISIKQSLMGATDKDMADILKVSRPDYSRFKNGIVRNTLKQDKGFIDIAMNIDLLNEFFAGWRNKKLKHTNKLIKDIKKYQDTLNSIEV